MLPRLCTVAPFMPAPGASTPTAAATSEESTRAAVHPLPRSVGAAWAGLHHKPGVEAHKQAHKQHCLLRVSVVPPARAQQVAHHNAFRQHTLGQLVLAARQDLFQQVLMVHNDAQERLARLVGAPFIGAKVLVIDDAILPDVLHGDRVDGLGARCLRKKVWDLVYPHVTAHLGVLGRTATGARVATLNRVASLISPTQTGTLGSPSTMVVRTSSTASAYIDVSTRSVL
jgi:hypothetical protein